MHDAVSLELGGLPTAAVVTDEFVEEAAAQAQALGMTDLRPAIIDHPLSTLSDDEIRSRAHQALPLVKGIWMSIQV